MTDGPLGLDALLNYVAENLDVNCEHRGGSYFDRTLCPAPCNAMHYCCKDCGEPLDECALPGSATVLAAHDPRFSGNHLGRSFNGTRLEDNCPCKKAPCGLVIQDEINPACTEHPNERLKSIRQSHRADKCSATETVR